LPSGTVVYVPGKTSDGKWLKVERDGSGLGYVYAPLLQEKEAWETAKREAEAAVEQRRLAAARPPKPSDGTPVTPAVGTYPAGRRPGDVFRDCDGCPEMVVVPAGAFQMGSTEAEREWAVKQGAKPGWVADEKPRHRVEIPRSFAVGKFEVTRGQYARFVDDVGYRSGDGCRVLDTKSGKWSTDKSKNWRDPGYSQAEDHPAVCVSWKDAKAYVAWLGRKTGTAYRLLSEAEWEYMARAGTDTMRYWGHDWDNDKGCAYANIADLSRAAEQSLTKSKDNIFMCRDGKTYTSPIGAYKENAFGLHDVLGNVWEWVEDCWNGSYSGSPSDGNAWTSGNCGRRVLRGGSWGIFPRNLRSAFRIGGETVGRVDSLGFRVARTL
jgi:formylglycine-generating enzyme required for sulfatase activity